MDEHVAPPQPAWQPLPPIDRRVLGVLVEKAKTTPAGYPMTANAITVGCNQKSNRHPLMELTSDEVQQSLDRLRGLGAVGEIHDTGRVPKYRHYLYQWLGVEKAELAVIAELLLRGEQTVGELRGRAARMEPIGDLAALQPVLNRLVERGLVIALSPPGRGQMVTHGLLPPRELERVRAKAVGRVPAAETGSEPFAAAEPPRTAAASAASAASTASAGFALQLDALRREVDELRGELDALRRDLADLRAVVE
jgi:uncharacterized protein